MNNIKKIEKNKVLNAKKLTKMFENIILMLNDKELLSKYVLNDKAFTRNRKLSLNTIVKLLFARVYLSLNLFLIIQFDKKKQVVSKQAFSKARKNIDPTLFVDLNNELVTNYYSSCKTTLYHKKYLILDIDGSSLELPNTEELRKQFGHSKGQEGAKINARASISAIYDPLNNLIVSSTIRRFNTSERVMAMDMINEVDNTEIMKDKKRLYIMDRGYFSSELLMYLMLKKDYFLFRLRSNSLKKYYDSMKSNDEWVTLPLKSMFKYVENEELKEEVERNNLEIKVRLTKVELSTGEIEYLLSNLEDIKYSEMKELYFRRWRIEENYKFIKTKLKIENFSGKSKVTIEQDFYSGILNANIQYLIDKVIGTKKTEKHEYKASMNILYGLYKEYISNVILVKKEKLIKYFRKLLRIASRCFIMKTPRNKSNPRNLNDKIRANIYFTNIRPN